MIGQVISHYKILEKLGEGGMGIVYKAHDTKLDRTVALKFLPPQVSATDQDRMRFVQEARAAAALNHPNICHIYRIDEADAPPSSERSGQKLMFIEMELVDGVTLRKRVGSGPVSLEEVLELAGQIGEALVEAHGRGIIHRDIKSDNVMLNARGDAKVMDFGLAKLKGALRLTRSSSTVGTLAYMAPEQLRGVEADARSDIFAFGVLFYEMLTGRLPFEGAHEAAVMYSITNEPPVPVEKYMPEAPAELVHIINRALEKDPEDRYQSVHDMVIDIRRLRKDSTRVSRPVEVGSVRPGSSSAGRMAGAGPGRAYADARQAAEPRPKSSSVTIPIPTGKSRTLAIAGVLVLAAAIVWYVGFRPGEDEGARLSVAIADFVNQTGEPELDGLSGMLTTAMEQSRRLSIVTRSHMFDILKQMGNAGAERIDEATGKQICARAGIGALVTASIRKLGRLYVIDLKVIDPSKDEYIFTAKEEGEGQEKIPGMLDNLSEKTRSGLRDRIDATAPEPADIAAVTTSNLEAYQLYFEGEQHLNTLEIGKAEKAFRAAVALDSSFGLAWYRLAYVINWNQALTGRENDALPHVVALVDRIPEKERYLARALIAGLAAEYDSAMPILREMEARYPNDKELLYNIGDVAYHEVKLDDALKYLGRTVEMDPTHSRGLQHLVWAYRDIGDNGKMLETAVKYADVVGNNESFNLLWTGYVLTGKYKDGLADLERRRTMNPGKWALTRRIAYFHELAGEFDKADGEIRKLLNSEDSTAVEIGKDGFYDLLEYRGELKRLRKDLADSLASHQRRKDTAAIAEVTIGLTALELFQGRSPKSAARFLKQLEQYDLSRMGGNVWAPMALMNLVIDPSSEIPPGVKATPASGGFEAMRLFLQGKCDEARATADSVLGAEGVPEFRAWMGYIGADCAFKQGRYKDAQDFIGKALGERSLIMDYMHAESILLQGKIHQESGNRQGAVEMYETLLKRFARADADLPILVETKARLAALKPGA